MYQRFETNLNSDKSVKVDNQKGYTLIELISILVIMGVLVSVVMKKYDLLSNNASITAIETGVQELRTRESITWFKIKLSEMVLNGLKEGWFNQNRWKKNNSTHV